MNLICGAVDQVCENTFSTTIAVRQWLSGNWFPFGKLSGIPYTRMQWWTLAWLKTPSISMLVGPQIA